MKSRFKRAMLLIEIFFGHSASQARVFVQLPNPSSSIFDNIAFARRKASGLPCGSKFNWLTFAETNNPIAQGLLGKKVGDVAEITVPQGKIALEVVNISI